MDFQFYDSVQKGFSSFYRSTHYGPLTVFLCFWRKPILNTVSQLLTWVTSQVRTQYHSRYLIYLNTDSQYFTVTYCHSQCLTVIHSVSMPFSLPQCHSQWLTVIPSASLSFTVPYCHSHCLNVIHSASLSFTVPYCHSQFLTVIHSASPPYCLFTTTHTNDIATLSFTAPPLPLRWFHFRFQCSLAASYNKSCVLQGF